MNINHDKQIQQKPKEFRTVFCLLNIYALQNNKQLTSEIIDLSLFSDKF